MNLDRIILTSHKNIERAGTRNPYIIAREIGVEVRFKDLGNQMGMYKYYDKNNRYITINQYLCHCVQILTCHHEIWHDINDQDIAKNRVLQDIRINLNDPIELRANMYAAETQFDDNDILEFVKYGYTTEQIAMETGTYTDYVKIKLEMLRYKGYEIKENEFNPYFMRVAEGKRYRSDYFPC